MTEKTFIPNRIKNASKEEPYVCGAEDIIDDSLGKPQSQVNQERIDSESTLDSKIAAETQRAEREEESLKNRTHALEELAEISVDGGTVEIVNTPEDIKEGSGAVATGNALAMAYGTVVDNPEFLKVITDADGRILWAIEKDGNIRYGAGVPNQVIEYVQTEIGKLLGDGDTTTIIDHIREIYAFLSDFSTSDTLKSLLDTKVDKEADKSLIPVQYIQDVDNPEFVHVVTDSEDRILYGVNADGNFYFGAGVPQQVIDYVLANKEETSEEVLAEKARAMAAEAALDEAKVDKEDGKSLIDADYAEGTSYVDNPEFIRVLADNGSRILIAVRNDGDVLFGYGVPTQIVEYVTEKIQEIIDGEISDTNERVAAIEDFLDGFEEDATLMSYLNGTYGEYIEDPESRLEVKTDSEGKIISYRDNEGVLHENVGIETPQATINTVNTEVLNVTEVSIAGGSAILDTLNTSNLTLTEEGMTEFQQALKDSGFRPGGAGDWSDAKSVEIPMPRCAMVNITNGDGMAIWPTSKNGRSDYNPGINADLHYFMEFYDMQGNYFKKEIIFSAQGNSSMSFVKKNGAVDICNNNGWDDDDTFSLKIGDWIAQDSFHFKAYYTDFLRGAAVVAYQLADEVYKTRGAYADRPWKKALIDFDKIGSITPANLSADMVNNMSLQIDNGARCMPDGFPAIFFLNGDFYGIYAWQLKKHRDNYHTDKNTAEHVHLDGTLSVEYLWGGNVNWAQFEIRNPKSLYCMDGSKYDGDHPQEIMDATSEYYDSTNKNHVKTAKVKQYILNLSQRISEIHTLDQTDRIAAKVLFDTYFDAENLIDYILINMACGDTDGFSKNWQWVTYDGIKWYVNPYDKDMAFGNYYAGFYTTIPRRGWLSNNINHPAGLTIQYYRSELKVRWSELVNDGIFTADHINKLLYNWMKRIGQKNYEKEWEKWPESPCNRNSNIDFENWIFTGSAKNNVPSSGIIWDSSTSYTEGDEVWFKSFDDSWHMQFRAIKANINKPCLTDSYTTKPHSMGYRDSLWRFYKFVDETISNQNAFFESL